MPLKHNISNCQYVIKDAKYTLLNQHNAIGSSSFKKCETILLEHRKINWEITYLDFFFLFVSDHKKKKLFFFHKIKRKKNILKYKI